MTIRKIFYFINISSIVLIVIVLELVTKQINSL